MNDELSNENEDSDQAPGWDAIDASLAAIYGDREPQHFAAVPPMSLGGRDPLDGISVYKNLEPEPHFHFVTYGFSELYRKESDDPEYSGFGFELTFRLASGADDPPNWVLNFLQNLARYVFSSGNAFDERHHMTLNGPIALNEATDITAIMLMLDPQLQEIDTPHGKVKFLQIVGLCTDEHHLIEQGYFDPIAGRVAAMAPLAITEIWRDSILKDPQTLEEILAAPPSTDQSEVFGTIAQWEEADGKLHLQIGATVIRQLQGMLKNVLGAGDACCVYGKEAGIVFQPGDKIEWEVDEGFLIVTLPTSVAEALADALEANRGIYRAAGIEQVTAEVLPVDIKDVDGNVIKTVG